MQPSKSDGTSLKGLHVYAAEGGALAAGVLPPKRPRKYGTRNGLAAWLTMIYKSETSRESPDIAAVRAMILQSASSAASSPEGMREVNSALTHLTEMKRASRDFWMSLSQFLLLNLLLPVFTAILGYVFGSVDGAKTRGPERAPEE